MLKSLFLQEEPERMAPAHSSVEECYYKAFLFTYMDQTLGIYNKNPCNAFPQIYNFRHVFVVSSTGVFMGCFWKLGVFW